MISTIKPDTPVTGDLWVCPQTFTYHVWDGVEWVDLKTWYEDISEKKFYENYRRALDVLKRV